MEKQKRNIADSQREYEVPDPSGVSVMKMTDLKEMADTNAVARSLYDRLTNSNKLGDNAVGTFDGSIMQWDDGNQVYTERPAKLFADLFPPPTKKVVGITYETKTPLLTKIIQDAMNN